MKQIIILSVCIMLSGCVGNKASVEASAIKIERKRSPAEEAQGWASALRTIWPRKEAADE